MKHKLKTVISNGLPYGLVLFALSFLTGHYLFKIDRQQSLWIAAFIGISALLANGLLYRRFTKPEKVLEKISFEFGNAELLIVQAPANHLIEENLVPGKLFLTNERLLFKTAENKSREYTWDVTDLKPVDFYKSIWNAGGEFILKTTDEISLMFEVDKLKPWKEAF